MSTADETSVLASRNKLMSSSEEFPPENKKLSSPIQSWFTTAKLIFGNAYLSIPNVFTFTGWLGGIFLFSSIGALNIYTMHQNL